MSSKLAHLHAGLVARKGEATPAVPNPMFSYVDPVRPFNREPVHREGFEDRDIDDSQFAARRVAEGQSVVSSAAVPDIVTRQDQEKPAKTEAFEAPTPDVRSETPAISAETAPRTDTQRENATGSTGRYRFTFRLTAEQRRRLRVAAAVRDQSLQQLLSTALDNHLDELCACSLKNCQCLAAAQADADQS